MDRVVIQLPPAVHGERPLALVLWLRAYELELRSPFGTSHSNTCMRINALLGVECCGLIGHGEIGLPPKKPGCYEADFDDIKRCWITFVKRIREIASVCEDRERMDDGDMDGDCCDTKEDADTPNWREEKRRIREALSITCFEASGNGGEVRLDTPLLDVLPRVVTKLFYAADTCEAAIGRDVAFRATRSGIEIALLDWWGKLSKHSVSFLIGALHSLPSPPHSFYTAALNGDISEIVACARFGAAHTPLLKIKLDADIERATRILRALDDEPACSTPQSVWSIDANGAWSPELAMRFLNVLEPYKHRVFMIEQPFPLFHSAANVNAIAIAIAMPLLPKEASEHDSGCDDDNCDISEQYKEAADRAYGLGESALGICGGVADSCWEFRSHQKGVDIFVKSASASTPPSSPESVMTLTCKGVTTMDATADLVIGMLGDYEGRGQWDEQFDGARLVQRIDDFHRVMYRTTRPPWPVTPRDMVLLSRTTLLSGGRIIVTSCSVGHKDERERSGMVRANLLYSALYAEPLGDGTRCRISFVLCSDPKGYIPNFIREIAAPKQTLFLSLLRRILNDGTHAAIERGLVRARQLQHLRSTVFRLRNVDNHIVPLTEVHAWMRVKMAYERAGILVYADESVCDSSDVEALCPIVSGVNVKMEKAGGYRAILATISTARRLGLRVWIGTMVGSVLLTNAAAALLPLASRGYGDVDGGLLVTDESQLFTGGFHFGEHGRIVLSDKDSAEYCGGVGVKRKQQTPDVP